MDKQMQVSSICRRAPLDTVVRAGGKEFRFWAYDKIIAQLKEGDSVFLSESELTMRTPYGHVAVCS